MAERMVFQVDLNNDTLRDAVVSVVRGLQGVESVDDYNEDNCTLTVVGTVDPERILHTLNNMAIAATIVRVDENCDHCDPIGAVCTADIMSAVADVRWIQSLSIDDDKCQLTVLGAVDPVKLAHKLKKKGFMPTIETVEDDKPKDPAPEKKKDPCQCQEACATMCMQSCYCSPYVLPNYYFYKA
ncbi:hypothetical protein ABZP36_015797 [Zizania latifolia]